jgi:glycosyltransferase involved in cell wall biosynthesis
MNHTEKHGLKKLSIYLPSLRGGGAERAMVTLANGFAARGHRVDLVLAKAEGPYLVDVAAAVRVIDLKAGGVFKSLPGLVCYLRRKRPDAMLSAMSHANVIALIARRLARVPTRLVVSERASLAGVRDHYKGLGHRLIRGLMRLTYPSADAVTVVARAMADDVAVGLGVERSRIHAIYNPVVTPALVHAALETPGHSWFSDGGPPVILSVGRLSAEKDFPTLIKAFATLCKQRPARLIILGEGEDRSLLEKQVQELGLEADVALPGFAANPYAYMRQAGLFVLSSRFEGLPGVLIQAMACGTPVVSTNCPTGPDEILENGRWGRLVPVGDVTALTVAMVETMAEANHPDVIRRAADFGEGQAVTRYLEVMGVTG